MRSLALLLTLACTLAAQSGEYRFVQLFVRDAPGREVKNLGGTVSFDGAGGFRMDGRIGAGQGSARDFRFAGAYQVVPEGGFISLPNPAQADLTLRLRAGPNGDVLAGSSVEEGQAVYDLFVAVRAPSEPVSNATLQGDYGAAFFLVYNGLGAGLATAVIDFTANGRGAIPSATLIGHAAGIDDVNRREKFSATSYAVRSDGTGGLSVHESSDIFFGDREIFVSRDGSLVLGYSTAEGVRDIFIAARKDSDQGTLSFKGPFWFSELMAEDDFALGPESARFSSASGSLTSDGSGSLSIAERVNLGGRRTNLTTSNSYQIGSDGRNMFSPRYHAGLHNFTLGSIGSVFLGAQVGIPGELTLEHGMFYGMRIPAPGSSGIYLNVSTSPIAPGAIVTLRGSGFASDAEVLVNGEPVTVVRSSPEQIDFLAPPVLYAPAATVQVRRGSQLSNSIQLPVSASAPVLISAFHANFSPITLESPAHPSETIILLATGIGAGGGGIRLYFDSRLADILFAGPMPGFTGFYQINVAVPEGLSPLQATPIALATTDSFADLATLPIAALSP